MSVGTAQTASPGPIGAKLAALRRAVSLWFWIDGLTVVCATAVGLSLLSLLVDRTLRMDRTQRLLSLGVAAVVLGVLAYRRLARPLLRALHDDALSLVVESQHAALAQSLISAVQFARVSDFGATGSSPAMVQASIDAGVRAASGVDFADTVDAQRRNRNLLAAAAALCLVGAACVLFPTTMRLWFQRNVLLSSAMWPQNTHLRVLGAQDGVIVCPRGDDLTVLVEADPDGVVPSVVTIRYRQPGSSGREAMTMVGTNVFRAVFKNVLEPFRFRASGGDADTPWCEVRLVERPAIATLDLAYRPPRYISAERISLPATIGPHRVPSGSTLRVEGVADKDLAQASLAFAKHRPVACEMLGDRRFRATLAGERLRSGAYAIALKDTEGYASRRPARFILKVQRDREPRVQAKLKGIGTLIVARATIPIHCRMTDDYAVESAEIVYAHHVEDGDAPTPRRTAFGTKDLFGGKQITTVYRLDLKAEEIKLPIGSQLTFHVEAKDNDTVSGPKVGVSGTLSLKVVTEGELRNELLEREQEQRMQFERLLRDQRKLLEDSQALLAALKDQDTPALPAERRRLLASAEKRQRLVAGRCIGIAESFAAILAEVENNRLEEAEQPLRQRLRERIIEPLKLLARRRVLQAADLLGIAREVALGKRAAAGRDATPGRSALADAAAEQEQIVASMRKILHYMVKWEGYQQAVTLLRDVLKAQKEVKEQTIREYQRRIERIFDK